MENNKDLIKYWLIIGRNNPWIAEADDPEFTKDMFYECKTIDELINKFEHGNWCLGQAFYYQDLCFINQVDGGDEWLTIRGKRAFESMSCGLIIERHGREKIESLIERFQKATDEQLKKLDY